MASPVTSSVTPFITGNTEYNAWAGAISAALDSAGVTKVACTGAVTSWGAVTKPGSTNSQPHFEIRKLNDPVSGSCPVWMRFNYGTGSGNINSVKLTLQVGTSANLTTGVLSGVGSAVAAETCFTGLDTVARQLYVASDGDGFVMVHALDSSTSGLRSIICVDRQRDDNGDAVKNSGWNDTGYMRLIHAESTGPLVLICDPVSGDAISSTRWPAVGGRSITTSTSLSDGTDISMFPVWIPNRQGIYNSKMLLAYPRVDANVNTLITLSYLGGTQTYRALGNQFTQCDGYLNAGSTAAIWWG